MFPENPVEKVQKEGEVESGDGKDGKEAEILESVYTAFGKGVSEKEAFYDLAAFLIKIGSGPLFQFFEVGRKKKEDVFVFCFQLAENTFGVEIFLEVETGFVVGEG